MLSTATESVIQYFQNFLLDDAYPCVAARAAMGRDHVPCMVARHMACPADDKQILEFIYKFISNYRLSDSIFHSAAVIFEGPLGADEETYERLLWERLQALAAVDAEHHGYDTRVSSDPRSTHFGFSLGGEAFFVILLNPASGRGARRFNYPAVAFNPHQQFEELRRAGRYEKMQRIVRKRDILYSGSVNPMLDDFGNASEARQYSGRHHGPEWKCPLKIVHGNTSDHSSEK